jgi:hypothetical protein
MPTIRLQKKMPRTMLTRRAKIYTITLMILITTFLLALTARRNTSHLKADTACWQIRALTTPLSGVAIHSREIAEDEEAQQRIGFSSQLIDPWGNSILIQKDSRAFYSRGPNGHDDFGELDDIDLSCFEP